MGASSSSSADITNINQDNRVAVAGGVGISGSTVTDSNFYVTDGGLVSRALDTVDYTVGRSLDSVDRSVAGGYSLASQAIDAAGASASMAIASNNANTKATLGFADTQISKALSTVDTTLGEGFGRMLDISQGMFDQGNALINRTQETVSGAYADAQNTAKGTIDNRTMIVLGVVAAAAIVVPMVMRRKG